MAAFNLTAELNLRGPSNLNQIVGNIRRQLSGISFNLNIDPNSSRNIQQITTSVGALSSALRTAQADASALGNALRGLGSNINAAAGSVNSLNSGLNNASARVNTVTANTRAAASEMSEFGRQSALAIRRFAAFSVATGAVYGLVRAVSSAYNEFLVFNKEFVRLQQVTGSSANTLSGLSNEITRLSTSLGVASSDLLQVSTTLAQAGLSAAQTKTALEALAKSALAPSFDNLNDTVEGSIALMRQFGLSAGDLESALGSINAVAAQFAVESSDIITAIQRTGGVFASASKGVSEGKDALNEFIAVFTSVRATTRESAETIATGLRTIFTRIQRGGTIEALKEFGITLTDIEGKFVGPYEAVRRLSEGLKSLDPRDLRFSQIVEELGGFRQIGKVIPLIQQFATAQQALGVAQRGAGSLGADAARAQDALAVKITKVREEFVGLIRDIGQSKSFQNFVDVSLQLASALISVASAAKDVLPALAALAAIKSIPAIGQFASGFSSGLGRNRRPRGFARGGLVPGSGNGDTVPAMLTPGEFVIRKKAVQTIGLNNLQNINSRYANGGKVQKMMFGGFPDPDASWDETLESIRRKYNLPSQAEVDRMTPAQKKEYEKRLSEIAFTIPGRGRPRKNAVADKEQKMRQGQLGLFFSAAGIKRGPKAPPGQYLQEMTKYQGAGNIGSVKPKFIAWGKGQGSFGDVVRGSEDKIRSQLSGEQLGYFDRLLQTGSLQNYLSSGGKMGHIPPLKKSIYRILGITGKNLGGIVQKFKNGKGVKKIPIEEQIQAGMIDNKTYKFGLVGLQSGTGQAIRDVVPIPDFTRGKPKKEGGQGVKKYKVELYRSTFFPGIGSKDDRDAIEQNIETSFRQMVTDASTMMATKLKSGKNANQSTMNKILKGSPLSTIVGTVFESALASLGSPFINKPEKAKSIDFPLGLGGVAKDFGIPGNIPTDATRTVDGSGKTISSMKAQIGRFIGAIENKEFSKGFAAKFQGPKNIPRDQIQSGLQAAIQRNTAEVLAASISKDMQTDPTLISKAPTGPKGDKLIAGVTPKQLVNAAKTGKMETLLKKLPNWIIQKHFLMRASGGAISDTVPALLTPGEFVINKKAAKRIGSAQLNRLNKADKIQGFNKGGAVGNIQNFASGGGVQRFLLGGAVSGIFNVITKSLQQLANILPRVVSRISSAGSGTTFYGLPRTGYGQARQGGAIAGRRDFTNQGSAIPQREGGGLSTALLFIGPLIGEAISSSLSKYIGGREGAAGGAIASSAISGATIGAAFGPTGALIGGLVGFAKGLTEIQSAMGEYTANVKQKALELASTQLDKEFERLSQATSPEDTNKAFSNIANTLQNTFNRQNELVQARVAQAQPGFISRTVFGSTVDIDTLAKDLADAGKIGGENARKFIIEALSKGRSFDEALASLGAGAKEALGGVLGGPQIARLQAEYEAANLEQFRAPSGETTKAAQLAFERYQTGLNAVIEETRKAWTEQQNLQKNIQAVTSAVDLFSVAIQNLNTGVVKALDQFNEAERLMNIKFGTVLGEQAQIYGPSRRSENILSNTSAYSEQDIIGAIREVSQNFQFDPEFTRRLENAALAQKNLQTGLAPILKTLSAERISGEGLGDSETTTLRDELGKLFDRIPNMRPEERGTAIDDIIKDVNKQVSQGTRFSTFAELTNNIPALNKVFKGFTDITEGATNAVKAFGDVGAKTAESLNRYVSALERATALQIEASTVQTQGQVQLAQALGQDIDLSGLNKAFEDSILRLTEGVGPLGIRRQGTLDPTEINKRRLEAETALKELNERGRPVGNKQAEDAFNRQLVDATLRARNLAKAQEKLASDTSRAANALSKISELRQIQEGRQNTFNEIIQNLNNPEWMVNFIEGVRSLQRVQSGQGTRMDLPAAFEAFNRRIQGLTPAQQQAERQQLNARTIDILTRREGLDPATAQEILRLLGVGQPQNELQEAINGFNTALDAQIKALTNQAVFIEAASQPFYDEVVQAGRDFATTVKEAAAAFNPDAPVAQPNASGGVVYASKGKLINFKPKGTDTVPSMLTPGEFVVNAKSTKKNLGLLKAINGDKSGSYSKGGLVYLAGGGLASKEVDEILRQNRERVLDRDTQEALRKFMDYYLSQEDGVDIIDSAYRYLSENKLDRNSSIGQSILDRAYQEDDIIPFGGRSEAIRDSVKALKERQKAKDAATQQKRDRELDKKTREEAAWSVGERLASAKKSSVEGKPSKSSGYLFRSSDGRFEQMGEIDSVSTDSIGRRIVKIRRMGGDNEGSLTRFIRLDELDQSSANVVNSYVATQQRFEDAARDKAFAESRAAGAGFTLDDVAGMQRRQLEAQQIQQIAKKVQLAPGTAAITGMAPRMSTDAALKKMLGIDPALNPDSLLGLWGRAKNKALEFLGPESGLMVGNTELKTRGVSAELSDALMSSGKLDVSGKEIEPITDEELSRIVLASISKERSIIQSRLNDARNLAKAKQKQTESFFRTSDTGRLLVGKAGIDALKQTQNTTVGQVGQGAAELGYGLIGALGSAYTGLATGIGEAGASMFMTRAKDQTALNSEAKKAFDSLGIKPISDIEDSLGTLTEETLKGGITYGGTAETGGRRILNALFGRGTGITGMVSETGVQKNVEDRSARLFENRRDVAAQLAAEAQRNPTDFNKFVARTVSVADTVGEIATGVALPSAADVVGKAGKVLLGSRAQKLARTGKIASSAQDLVKMEDLPPSLRMPRSPRGDIIPDVRGPISIERRASRDNRRIVRGYRSREALKQQELLETMRRQEEWIANTRVGKGADALLAFFESLPSRIRSFPSTSAEVVKKQMANAPDLRLPILDPAIEEASSSAYFGFTTTNKPRVKLGDFLENQRLAKLQEENTPRFRPPAPDVRSPEDTALIASTRIERKLQQARRRQQIKEFRDYELSQARELRGQVDIKDPEVLRSAQQGLAERIRLLTGISEKGRVKLAEDLMPTQIITDKEAAPILRAIEKKRNRRIGGIPAMVKAMPDTSAPGIEIGALIAPQKKIKSDLLAHEGAHVLQSRTPGQFSATASIELKKAVQKFIASGKYAKMTGNRKGFYTADQLMDPKTGKLLLPDEILPEIFRALSLTDVKDAFDPFGRRPGLTQEFEKFIGRGLLQKYFRKTQYRNQGGMVYASKGRLIPYAPKGTDTVPAMLTPGEFVVNAKAAKKNMGLLRSINGGAKGYSKGGIAYLQDGGQAAPTPQRNGNGLFGMRFIADAIDTLFAWDLTDANIQPFEFERAAMSIEQGLRYIKKQSELSPNNIDNQAVTDFESAVNTLLQTSGEMIAKMSPEEFNDWRLPYNTAYNKLNSSITNPNPPPKYILDDLLNINQNPINPINNPLPNMAAAAANQNPINNPLPDMAAAADQMINSIPESNYYDKLTYKEYLDKLVNMNPPQAPVPPDRSKFLTPAMYVRNNESGMSGRITAIDERIKNDQEPLSDLGPSSGPQARAKAQALDQLVGLEQQRQLLYPKIKDLDNYPTTDPLKSEVDAFLLAVDKVQEKLYGSGIKNMSKLGTSGDKTDVLKPGQFWYEFEDLKKNWSLQSVLLSTQRGDINYANTIPRAMTGEISRTIGVGLGRFYLQEDKKDERIGITGYSSPDAQYRESVSLFKVRRGEFNYRAILDNRKNQYIAEKQRRKDAYNARRTANMSSGGVIYASKGQLIPYEPRGTDTVPAMLTPGEFVVNRKAAKKNMGLLKAINNNQIQPQALSSGGFVSPKYLQNGSNGPVSSGSNTGGGVSVGVDTSALDSAFSTFGGYVNTLSSIINTFSTGAAAFASSTNNLANLATTATAIGAAAGILSGSAGGLNNSITSFNNALTQFTSALSEMPTSIDFTVSGSIPVSVNVNVNGGEGLQDNLQAFADTIYNEVSRGISDATNGALKVQFSTTRR